MGLLWNREPRVFKDKADELIYRSTGLFHQLDFRILIRIIYLERTRRPRKGFQALYPLSDLEVTEVLDRYYDHCRKWGVSLETYRTELTMFAHAVERPYRDIVLAFNERTKSELLNS